jgi:hypothetical protein
MTETTLPSLPAFPTLPAPITAPPSHTTAAFQAQAAAAFALSLGFLSVGILYLPVDRWQRGFLVLGVLFTVSSCFTLAKVVRDAQEQKSFVSRIDEARRERLMAAHDPYAGA